MSESKIGKWLTRDGRTAVVFAESGEKLFGVVQAVGRITWCSLEWLVTGLQFKNDESVCDLVRKVSDSTDLTPYVPVKRVRPWTRAEVEAIVQQRPLWVIVKDCRSRAGLSVGLVDDKGFETMVKYYTFNEASQELVQLDGSPCGVEVEE